MNHYPSRVAHELREHLASSKRKLGFFMGAGTSMAVGLPGIVKLTESVEGKLIDGSLNHFNQFKEEIGGSPNVEEILNRIRLVRELLGDKGDKNHNGIDGQNVKALDLKVCSAIHEEVSIVPPGDTSSLTSFAQWLHSSYSSRGCPVEIFTTNYDLLFEQAMEQVGVPYFDGFIGTVHPFFSPESVEADSSRKNPESRPPRAWTRLWKLHGSVNWYFNPEAVSSPQKVVRLSGEKPSDSQELMVFPSREKYTDSRKLPFITFQDRLRQFLSDGESVLFIIGYSFQDEHLNEIIFQALRSNSRLAVNAMIFGEKENVDGKDVFKLPPKIVDYARAHRNLSAYGPDSAVVGGIHGSWVNETSGAGVDSYWDNSNFSLGDFQSFSRFLERFIGFGTKGFERKGENIELEVGK